MTISEILTKHGLSHVDVYTHPNMESHEYVAAVTLAASIPEAIVECHQPGGWRSIPAQTFNWRGYSYRISPLCRPKVSRPWRGPEDVPFGTVWFRHRHHTAAQGRWQALDLSGIGLVFAIHVLGTVELNTMRWSDVDRLEWSTDGVTWAKCEVITE